VVSVESGFVLILVLPAAMLLLMSALSMVSRSNSAAIASVSESRAQAARMAAESGLNEFMARVNNAPSISLSDPTNLTPLYIGKTDIVGSSQAASFRISYHKLSELPDVPPDDCTASDTNNSDLEVTIEGKLTDNGTDYTQNITRTLRVCTPAANRLRVRAVIQKES
jgi:hypothetical protein